MNTRASRILLLCTFLIIGILLAGCGGGGGGSTTPLNLQDKIFYHAGMAGNYEIYSMNLDGTETRQLTTQGINQGTSITADGRNIAFESDRTGVSQVFIMRYDGSHQTQLTSNSRPSTQPAISGDGSKIVFVRSVDFITPSDIYIMNSDGSNPTVIPNTSGANSPALNYDASKLTFTAFDGTHNTVFLMDIDGSNKTNIMSAPRTLGESPKFSPDDSKIIYCADAVMNHQIIIYDIASATDTIARDETNIKYPCFSPDGSKIIFVRQELGDEFIYSMNLDGTGTTKLSTVGLELCPACPMIPGI